MRRLTLGLILGALIFGSAFAGAKLATVTNPMSADLDGGGHIILNTAQVNSDWLIANNKVSVNGAELLAGAADPSLGLDADAGSLYLRRAPDALNVAHGQLWLKTGINPTDWLCAAGCPVTG